MGKGYRNRDDRISADEVLTKNAKVKKKKKARGPMPKWIVPTIVTVVAICAVVGIVFGVLFNNGFFKRSNVLVKSQENGKYNVNQTAAAIMTWYSGWVQGENAYYNAVLSGATTSTDSSNQFAYAWSYASAARTQLHDVIEESAEWLEELTAMCDWGAQNNVAFTAEDEKTAYENLLSAFRSQAKLYYSYFASGQGLENYVDNTAYPYFSAYLQDVFGTGFNSSDFRRAATILTYAGRIRSMKESEFWNADQDAIDQEIKENPEDYYSVGYLSYQADSDELAAALAAATDADSFKKAIVANLVKTSYFEAYNKALAESVLTAVSDKDAETIAEALEAQGMVVEEALTKETATLTEAQKEWLFDTERAAYDATSVLEADSSSTVIVLTDIEKDEEGNITAVKAAFKTFAQGLTDEEIDQLINEVCHHLGLPHEDVELSEELEDLAETLESTANSKLPSESSTSYEKKTDWETDLETAQKELEEAEDKTSYMTQKNAQARLGISVDKKDEYDIDEAIAAFVFAEDTKEGDIKVIETDNGRAKHLIYISDVTVTEAESEEEEDSTHISYYDYKVSAYSGALAEWLFQNVDAETLDGCQPVGATFQNNTTVYLVTRAFGLGIDVVRGGYVSFSNEDEARAANEQLEGLTGIELLNKLSEINTDTTTSNKIKESSISSTVLKEWLFDEARKSGDHDVVMLKDENNNINGLYVAVFLYRTTEGESDARTSYADEATDEWAHKLAEDGGYQLSASALAKIKNMDTSSNDHEEEE